MTNVQRMSELGLKFQNNKVSFPPPWESIYASLKEIGFFKRFVPVDYGGSGTTEENIYFIMELLGYTCPSLGIIFVAHSRAVDLILAGVYTILVNTKGKKGARCLSVFVVEDEIEGFRVGLLYWKRWVKNPSYRQAHL